jgi:hypothetical protein
VQPEQRSLYFGYLQGVSMIAVTFSPLVPVYVPGAFSFRAIYLHFPIILTDKKTPIHGAGLDGAGSSDWDINFRWSFALACLNLLYVVVALPESLPAEGRPTMSLDSLNPLAPLRFLARSKLVRTLAIGAVCPDLY